MKVCLTAIGGSGGRCGGLRRPNSRTLKWGRRDRSPDGGATPFHPHKVSTSDPAHVQPRWHKCTIWSVVVSVYQDSHLLPKRSQILMTAPFWFLFRKRKKKRNQQWEDDEASWLSRSANKTAISLCQGCARCGGFSSRGWPREWSVAVKCWWLAYGCHQDSHPSRKKTKRKKHIVICSPMLKVTSRGLKRCVARMACPLHFKAKQWKSGANILSSLSSWPDLAEGRINVLTESSLYSQRRLQRRFIQEFSGAS